MNYKQILEAKELAPTLSHAFAATADICPAFLFQYVPDGGDSGAACTAAHVQGTSFTVLVDGAAPTGNDAIGTAGVIDPSAAAYDTVGEFCNYVNSLRAYRAVCLCRPETPMANVLAKSATSCLTDNGLVFYLDTSVADTTYIWSAPITGTMLENYGLAGLKSDIDDHCVNRFHYAQVNHNFSSASNWYLYIFKQGDTSSTQVISGALTDATLTNVGNNSQPKEPWYEAPEGYTLVFEERGDAATGMAVFNVLGSTVVRRNNRVVNRLAYKSA